MRPTGVAALMAALALVAGCGHDAATATLTVAGTVTLDRGISVLGLPTGECEGALGFDDVRPGAQVTVSDAAGKKVGVGALGQGTLVGDHVCKLKFRIPEVPGDSAVYSVRVANRADFDFAKKDAGTLRLGLTYPR